MTIFNSLGSNYDWQFVLKSLFAKNSESFRYNLKSFLEKKYYGKAILVYKGREAIMLALEILNFPKGSDVAINGFTCYAVYRAISNEGYETELLDLNPSSAALDLNFSAELLKKRVEQNPKIKVVIIQNTLGYPCNIEKIAKICRENNIILIEDIAHSVGTTYANGKEAGTIGDFVVLSFSQDKIIDAVSGGALIIRNKKYNNLTIQQFNNVSSYQQLKDRLYPAFTYKIRFLYHLGLGKFIHFMLKKINLMPKVMDESFYAKCDLPNWYSYLVLECFYNLKKNLEHRKEIANIYYSTLNHKITSDIINANIGLSANLRYPIFVNNRKSLIAYLKEEGVYVSDIWYDSVDEGLTNAKAISDTIINLPTHKNISARNAKILAGKINQWLQSQ